MPETKSDVLKQVFDIGYICASNAFSVQAPDLRIILKTLHVVIRLVAAFNSFLISKDYDWVNSASANIALVVMLKIVANNFCC